MSKLPDSIPFAVAGILALTLSLPAAGETFPQNPPSAKPSTTPAMTGQSPAQTPAPAPQPAATAPVTPRVGLNIVVLDAAHGGADLGARGTEGIRESEVVLQFAAQVKKALEAQGFQVLTTRDGNDDPTFDDRSARANSQRGAVFITLHLASTGLAGTARVYVMPDMPATSDTTGLIPWDRAQGPFVGLSRKLGDLVQSELAKRFKGSPDTVQLAPVRQLRTVAAPAIAVEISSVSVPGRAELDRMVPGVAEAIAQGVSAFRPSYVVPVVPVTSGGVQR